MNQHFLVFVYKPRTRQDVEWFKSRSVETSEGRYEMQPEESLCKKCGGVICSFVNEPDKAALVRRAVSNRAFRAEVMLLHEVGLDE